MDITMKKVVLYGKSLLISSVGASLEDCPDLEVHSIDPSGSDMQQIRKIKPYAVIFDLAAIQPDFSIELWKAQPDLLLIGVDLMTGKSMVFSSQPARVLTTADLIQLLRNKPAQDGSDAD
jgi:hypothetical protein